MKKNDAQNGKFESWKNSDISSKCIYNSSQK